MKIEVFPTHLRFADGDRENHQHNAPLGSIVEPLRNQLLTASNSALFTPADYSEGNANVTLLDYRYLVSSSSSSSAITPTTTQTTTSLHLVPSIVEFEMKPTDASVCHGILEIVHREEDPQIRQQLLKSLADIEARILVATHPDLCLDPSPSVEREATIAAYNSSKYKAAIQTSPGISARVASSDGPTSRTKAELRSRHNSGDIPKGLMNGDGDLARLMLVNDPHRGGAGADARGKGESAAGAMVSSSSAPTAGNGFRPRFARLEFIEEYRKRKRVFDSEIMLGLDTRRQKQKTDKKIMQSTEPEYMALNGMKVIRTVRFEQVLKHGTIFTILNIVETGTPDEYEAILRVGNEQGNANGPYGTTLRYPVGNITAVDNYLGYFKSFYTLNNKMTGVLVTVTNPVGGAAANGGTTVQGTL
ncbi:hypothetical protein CcCBS67573_g01965 [Chytriomyces confervae]|uniref:Uncharacterized protein n=1 Tax=Chytriomyces confervae TaxID=246404 RepID=A0A507FM79_9FUNG|nr:hypothetical protein HDU80_004690 [Chytriomyces hyalinus]TPX76735.1 hypothetical protein CcCBS67573_g01965 [Chytriomyces confervae]